MSLRLAIESILQPNFTEYQNNRKRPTRESVVRLLEEQPPEEELTNGEIQAYLVEVRLGYLTDLTAAEDNTTFPAVREIYMSKNGLLFKATIKAQVNDDGSLTPVKDPSPVAHRPIEEGEKANETQLQTFLPVLKEAHNLSFE